MEEEQKVDIVEKTAVKEEDEEVKEITVNDDAIKVDKTETDEEKMEVDTQTVKPEKQEDMNPLVLKVEQASEGIAKLIIEGIETEGDEDEEYVVMTPEEIQSYLEQQISENVNDPEVNPLLRLQNRSQSLLEEIKDKYEQISKLSKALEGMYRNQERFLRHMEIFPKVPTNSVSVSVDLPLLLDSVPLMAPSKAPDEEAVIRKDLPEAKVLHPSNSKTKTTVPAIPTVPSGTTITPAVPKPNPASSGVVNAVKSQPKLPPKPPGEVECIDLTDDTPAPPPAPSLGGRPVTNYSVMSTLTLVKHPAPLPPRPFSAPNKSLPNVPPKPRLKISSEERGIVLQWDMPPSYSTVTAYSKLKCFDIFGYQEQKNVVINTLLWKKIGAVKAMTLPMACTLTQFLEGQKYHFSIRAVDVYDRCGSYSDPISIVYKPHKKKPKPPKKKKCLRTKHNEYKAKKLRNQIENELIAERDSWLSQAKGRMQFNAPIIQDANETIIEDANETIMDDANETNPS